MIKKFDLILLKRFGLARVDLVIGDEYHCRSCMNNVFDHHRIVTIDDIVAHYPAILVSNQEK